MEQVKQYNPKMYEQLNAVITPTTIASIMDRESSGQINDPNDAKRDYIGPYKMGLEAMREADKKFGTLARDILERVCLKATIYIQQILLEN